MSQTKKSSSSTSEWGEFIEAVFSTATMLGTFGFKREVGVEYARILSPKCAASQALKVLREMAAETDQLPSPNDILNRIHNERKIAGMIKLKSADGFCYAGTLTDGKVVAHHQVFTDGARRGRPTGTVLLYTMVCGCSDCEAVREFGAEPEKQRGPDVHWSKCDEGRAFAEQWGKMSGKPLGSSLKKWGEQAELRQSGPDGLSNGGE